MNEGRVHQWRGRKTEAIVTSRLIERGISVSMPVFGAERYDLVLDRDGVLERVQVKTAYDHHARDETFVAEFDCTVYDSDGNPQKTYYTRDELDAYLIYYEPREMVLYAPFEETPKTQMNFSLRAGDEYNDFNRKAINFAEEYTLSERL